ncbi:MAG: (cytosine-5-)-methyltransferase [Deinococcus sp.]|nr:(cytosine-5-)-methyltransferase [Deinococcus sp.]
MQHVARPGLPEPEPPEAGTLQPGTLEHYQIQPHAPRLTVVDLFAGAGGLSLGLAWAGFQSIGAVEANPAAATTYDSNFGAHIVRDGLHRPVSIQQVDFTPYRGRVDLLAGGPPCQGFSQLGRGLSTDPRNQLWREYMRAAAEIRPSAFLIENVAPILRSEEGEAIVTEARRLGYDVTAGLLSAELFGVPQKRKRAFFIGVQRGNASLPLPQDQPVRTVRWALRGLSLAPDQQGLHVGRNPTPISQERYRAVPAGGNRFDLMRGRPDLTPACWINKKTGATDVFGRLWWDRPSVTIRTEFYKPEKGRYLHPDEHRPITHREAARLQTFPDDFSFSGSRTEIAVQIGNAVPPVLAFHLGQHLAGLLGHTS